MWVFRVRHIFIIYKHKSKGPKTNNYKCDYEEIKNSTNIMKNYIYRLD
jgi:hypothetical protein